jgi:transposase
MPTETIAHSLLLPELEFTGFNISGKTSTTYHVTKQSEMEVCPKCATPSRSVYDHRVTKAKDAPVRDKVIYLMITKRRFWCAACRKPFTEPVPGITKGQRTTQRFKKAVLWGCENFVDLKRVQAVFHVSPGFVFKTLYEQLELKRKMHNQYPWPKTIGIDEHSWKRNKKRGYTEFASIIVNYDRKKVFELVEGKTSGCLSDSLQNIPGRENVKNVILDMCDSFKSFTMDFFPNARLIADKFHVLRLITPHINKKRKEMVGDRRKNPIGRLLLKNGYQLDHWKRQIVIAWLNQPGHEEIKELYTYKEALHKFYRTKGLSKASHAFTRLTDAMAVSSVKAIKTLRGTLLKWRKEILAYFETGLTNGRTEGFNNLAKLVQRRAFGYRNFKNYRLRLLSACQ